ncbi:MAG: hypothetical protein E7452_00390 [Ruminococcaceae bacterium]|nr:hypothetical protein [Oscillospiraceae bacterium]MBQ4048565.1 hypothetical protein [Clostridia bacterium]
MDIKAKINEIVDRIKNDDGLMDLFKSDPVKAIEKVIGVDLPDDKLAPIVDGVKAKLTVDNAKDLFGSLKKLF